MGLSPVSAGELDDICDGKPNDGAPYAIGKLSCSAQSIVVMLKLITNIGLSIFLRPNYEHFGVPTSTNQPQDIIGQSL